MTYATENAATCRIPAALMKEMYMQQRPKLMSLAAIIAATALVGCANRTPAPTAVVVVPPSQTAQAQQQPQQAATTMRSGTIVAVQNLDPASGAGSQGASSSGGVAGGDASSAGQLLTVQFDNGQRQSYQVAPGGVQFQMGERVNVDSSQSVAVITPWSR